MSEQIDFQKAFKLTVEAPLMDKTGKVFAPGIYQAGEISKELMQPIYGHNIDAQPLKSAETKAEEVKPVVKVEEVKPAVKPAG